MGGLAPGADIAGRNELPDIGFEGGPPEAATDELGRSDGPGLAG